MLLVLSVVGLLLNRCILMVRRRVLFWDPSEKAKAQLREGVDTELPETLARDPRAKKEVRAW